MQRLLTTILLLILISESCISQIIEKKTFGTKNIDHQGIAIDFMGKIKNEQYQACYEFLSEDYKTKSNLEDFVFRMKMLKNLAEDDEFYHYHTTYIGKTPMESFARLSGKEVKKNIMPEYDFTINSESGNDFKTTQIFLRFENEDSDKISVINYAKHKLLNEETGMSSASANPFFTGQYILVTEIQNEIYADIRGGTLRESLKKIQKMDNNTEILIKIAIDELAQLFSTNDFTNYSLIYVREEDDQSISQAIRALAEENGFSRFNHKNKEFIQRLVNNGILFKKKYEMGHWNPFEK